MTYISGMNVLITGAAQGIGKEMSLEFARHGANIILTDINESLLTGLANRIRHFGVKAYSYKLDVTNRSDLFLVKGKILDEVGQIDVLVNNAGVVFGGPFVDTSLQCHELTYKVNIFGMLYLTHAFLSELIKQPEAHIVNVASASGLIPLPLGVTYASSKWAAIGFSESLRAELELSGNKKVKVTTVCPSYISTGMFDGVKAPFLTPVLTPQKVAKKVVRAVRKDKRMVLEPFIVKFIPLLNGILPAKIFDFVTSILGVTTSMRQWKGHS